MKALFLPAKQSIFVILLSTNTVRYARFAFGSTAVRDANLAIKSSELLRKRAGWTMMVGAKVESRGTATTVSIPSYRRARVSFDCKTPKDLRAGGA